LRGRNITVVAGWHNGIRQAVTGFDNRASPPSDLKDFLKVDEGDEGDLKT
jgi:hypothetical protein